MKIFKLLLALVAFLATSLPLQAQESSLLQGSVVDAATGTRVPDVIIRVGGTNVSAVSDAEGRFVLRGLPVGAHSLEVRHPMYGGHSVDLAVSRGGEEFEVAIQISSTGVRVEVVDATPAMEAAPPIASAVPVTYTEEIALAPASGPAVRAGTVVDRSRIQQMAGASRNVGDLLRRAMPTLQVREFDGMAGDALCLEFRGTQGRSMSETRSGGTCNNPQVYLDGVPLTDPAMAYGMTAFEGIQWIQAIPPGEVGAQFSSATYGVILIATTSGATRMAPASSYLVRSRRTTFDWELDPNGHNFLRAFLGSAVGNAVGLAAGREVGRQCIYIEDRTQEIETSCPKAGVAGVGLVAFALPALGSALGAHWGGGTDVSVGRWIPALIGAGMAIFPGYVYALTTVGGGVEATNNAGMAFLLVGTPLLTTVADRLHRKLRNR